MSKYIVLTMTDASRLAMLDYQGNGLDVKFSHIGLGAGNYTANAQTESLQEKWADFPIIGGFVDTDNHCLILTTMGQLNEAKRISEIGLYGDDGALFAVASLPQDYYLKTEPGCYFSFSVSVALDQKIEGQKIKLSFAPQELILQALLNLHLQHKNPHPQYNLFMAELIRLHIAQLDPHEQYATKVEVLAKLKEYTALINKLINLFMLFFKNSIFAGYGTDTTINLGNDFSGNLLNNQHAILLTPEGGHEGWSIARKEKAFSANIFNRSGQNRIGYGGKNNWIVLGDGTDNPISGATFPDLLGMGVVPYQGGLSIPKPSGANIDLSNVVILMTPEGQNEGWSIARSAEKINANIFNRSGTSRIGYSGLVSYAVLNQKVFDPNENPTFFPHLLMAGVSEVGNFKISRPDGEDWDLRDSNYVLAITPEGGHEAWGISRVADGINVSVFNRSGTNRVGYGGKVSWALFQKEGEMELYRAGKYTITIPANSIAEFHLVGAGGSGAGSMWASKISANWLKMEKGGNTSLTIDGALDIIAGGGDGGYRGVWNNGSAYIQGVAGVGGAVNVAKLGTAEIINQIEGQKAFLETAHDWCNRDVRGGETRWKFGAGGVGGQTVETKKHRCYGAGGGSGAYVAFTVKNPSSNVITAELIVGDMGAPDTIPNDWNNGKSGEAGCATVKITPLR